MFAPNYFPDTYFSQSYFGLGGDALPFTEVDYYVCTEIEMSTVNVEVESYSIDLDVTYRGRNGDC